jgi:integrase
MTEQHLNKAVKEVAKMAGITTMVEQVSIRGGKEVTEQVEKYKLVCTHTARRTGATLLYLDKWSMDEIALMTGHKKMDKLQIYLKSTARENARVLREKRMKR